MSNSSKSFKVKAKILEILGLVFLLIASFWQFFIVSFIEESFVDSHNYTEEEIYWDLLESQEDIALMFVIEDMEKKYETLNRLTERNGKRRSKTIQARQEKFEIWREGAKVYKNVRMFLFILGSLLLIISNFLELKGIKLASSISEKGAIIEPIPTTSILEEVVENDIELAALKNNKSFPNVESE